MKHQPDCAYDIIVLECRKVDGIRFILIRLKTPWMILRPFKSELFNIYLVAQPIDLPLEIFRICFEEKPWYGKCRSIWDRGNQPHVEIGHVTS